MSKNLSISILIAGVLVSCAIFNSYNLDTLAKIFTILGDLSIGVALLAYLYKKRQDRTLAAIDQISFFRENIIPEMIGVQKTILGKDPSFWFSRINLSENKSIEDVKKNFSINFEKQLSIFFNITEEADGCVRNNIDPVLDEQIKLLNMLEELSLRVSHFGTESHPALSSIHAPFVELVEMNAVALIFMRDIRGSQYKTVLSLYDYWRARVEGVNVLQNLEKHGFITKDQFGKTLKKQRDRVRRTSKKAL